MWFQTRFLSFSIQGKTRFLCLMLAMSFLVIIMVAAKAIQQVSMFSKIYDEFFKVSRAVFFYNII